MIHSFTLNEMRVKQDADARHDRARVVHADADRDWEIACSQLCGLGHYRMRGEYPRGDAAAWEAWMADEVARIAMTGRTESAALVNVYFSIFSPR